MAYLIFIKNYARMENNPAFIKKVLAIYIENNLTLKKDEITTTVLFGIIDLTGVN